MSTGENPFDALERLEKESGPDGLEETEMAADGGPGNAPPGQSARKGSSRREQFLHIAQMQLARTCIPPLKLLQDGKLEACATLRVIKKFTAPPKSSPAQHPLRLIFPETWHAVA